MDDYIYWTDGDTNSVNRFRKTDNLEREELMAGLTSVGHVIIVRNEDVENRGNKDNELISCIQYRPIIPNSSGPVPVQIENNTLEGQL